MYLSFFGLNEKPFAITPDPRYLYLSARHSEALAHLLYGISESGGFVQLTGEVGTGKTTIVRSLLAQVPKDAEIALILNPRMTAPEFLLTICEEIGIGVQDAATGSVKDLVDILNSYLLRAHAEGRRVVLVVDEAQNLAPDVLEQVRLLTNLETTTQKLLQIILIGQPELRELLARTELRQLAQRITGRYHLDPLSREEAAAYVRHRLRVAGATTEIFTNGALREVYRLSGGVPRVINVICDRALLGAYTQDQHTLTGATVRRAAAEVFGRPVQPAWLPAAMIGGAAALLVIIALLAWQRGLFGGSESAAPPPDSPLVARVAPGAGAPTGAAAAPGASDAAAGVAGAATTPGAAAGTIPTGAAAAGTVATSAAARKPVPLAPLLAAHADSTDTDTAFERLFALWRASYVAGPVDACEQAARQKLECLVERGSFGQLQVYNRPAILILNDDQGGSHQVVLTALRDEDASLDIGGTPAVVSIAELSRYWLGDFVLLWRPDTATVKPLAVGTRGDEVRWLRRSLGRLRGVDAGRAVSDVYDAELSRQVMDFQRAHRLAVDGVAGVQTQVVLNGAVSTADSPLLVAGSTKGS